MKKSEVRLHAFGRACHFIVDNTDSRGDEHLALCKAEMERLETKFSSYHSDSLTSRINQAAGTGSFVALDAESRSLFDYVDALWTESKHIYDPTTRILQDCYDEDGRLLASRDQLQGMLKLVGWPHLERDSQGVRLAKKGMLLDLNACICSYAVDSLKKILIRQGVETALLEMDKDIATIGRQPDGANWLVGVRLPRGSRAAIARLKLNNRGYSMRGNFEQAVTVNGERFGRALSPVDGQPIPGLLSVAVIADNCLTAGSAASVARLKTETSAVKWLDNLGLPWLAVDRQLNWHGPLAPRA